MRKINWKRVFFLLSWLSIAGLLIYTRTVNLGWGLPYPMHPDERNMAVSLQSLRCNFPISAECFNPHFFAYGQLPLYLGYGVVWIIKFFWNSLLLPISLPEAIFSLRVIASVSSILSVAVVLMIVRLFVKSDSKVLLMTALMAILQPYAIQLSHFGTTESLLMFFYLSIIYLSLRAVHMKAYLVAMSIAAAAAVATKISALVFVAIPALTLFFHGASRLKKYLSVFVFAALTIVFAFVFSPHNFISRQELLGALSYESDVAFGRYIAFYTRQFIDTPPVLFQFTKVFPYALGWPVLVLGSIGFFLLSWRDKKISLLRLSFLLYFFPNAYLFAKWSRFMAPVFPIFLILAILFLASHAKKVQKYLLAVLVLVAIVPGVAYLSVYRSEDVRFTASRWISENIKENSYILSETANVVDIPIAIDKNYQVISFNFYELENDLQLQMELKEHLERAEYILVPSRRIFANHPGENYPILSRYYEELFNGRLGFKKVAEFSSNPTLKVFGLKLIEFPDEQAEETWSVFDHPVIRIFKRSS